jgi:predicted nucleic acid-binding protein
MPAEAVVADASVLAALLFGEPRASEAVRLLRDADLYEPALLPFELASIARKKARGHPEKREAILRALQIGLSLAVTWVDVDHLAVVELALATGLTTYDAAYLEVAQKLRIALVTFDEALRQASSRQ